MVLERGIQKHFNLWIQTQTLLLTTPELGFGELGHSAMTRCCFLYNCKKYNCFPSYSILIQAGANVDSVDNDGWTSLHAASHWGQKEAVEILVENMCEMSHKNNLVGEVIVVI